MQFIRNKWFGLSLLFVMYVINIIDRHIINILVEPIKHDLDLSDAQIGFLTGIAFALFYTVMGVPIAVLADRFNRAKLIAACSAVWCLMTAATGAASSYFWAALSRMGVGVGEAGLTPAATSLIGDMFRPADRGKAIGLYMSAVPIGTMLAGWVAGWLADSVGWRMTFIALGIVGALFTLAFLLVFVEPPRATLDDVPKQPERNRYSIVETAKFIHQQKSCRYFFPAFAIVGFVGAAINNWSPAFFMRSHGMSLVQMATSIGTVFGVGGAIGMVAGGLIADRAAKRDVASYLKIPAWALLATLPLYFGVYLSPNAWIAGMLLVIPVINAAIILPPVLALLQRLVKSTMRAVSVSLLLLVLHLAGMGFGPLIVGALSDLLSPYAGADSLRYALLCVIPLNLVAVHLFWRGSNHIADDLRRMHGGDGMVTPVPART